jgi:transcriptional antiterminator RfaH
MHWHIALTQPGQDRIAAAALRARCYLVYDPVCRRRVRLARGRSGRKLSPMFPGYLFVDAGGQSWDRLRSAPGVRTGDSLLTNHHGEYALVPPAIFDEIRHTELAMMAPLELPPAFQPGERLKITDGPWSGYFGPVDRLDGDEAVRLLLNVFGRSTPVSIPIEFVAPAEINGLGASPR